jgi:hypothetical protein
LECLVTPDEVIGYARQQYNAVGDRFFSDEELYRHVWFAQDVLAKEALAIENTYSTPTVASQQEYTYPANAISIKRITCDGERLTRIKLREDDLLTGFDAATTQTGKPTHYALWNRIIYLRPVPATVVTLKIFTYDHPQEVSSTSVLDIPETFHLELTTFVLWRMCMKDQNFQAANYYKPQWDEVVERAKKWARKRIIGDSFNVVRDEEDLADTTWGRF